MARVALAAEARLRLTLSLAGALSLLAVLSGCRSGSGAGGGADAGHDEAGDASRAGDAAGDADTGEPDANPWLPATCLPFAGDNDGGVQEAPWEPFPEGKCAVGTRPPEVPADWQRYDELSCNCRFFIPGPAGTLPAGPEWGTCPAELAPGSDCRILLRKWPACNGFAPGLGEYGLYLWREPLSGDTYLQYAFSGYDHSRGLAIYSIVSTIDGQVQNAFFQLDPPNASCDAFERGVQDGMVLYALYDDAEIRGEAVDGFIGGPLGERSPSHAVRLPGSRPLASVSPSWAASSRWVVRSIYTGSVTVYSWDAQESHVVYSAGSDRDGSPVRYPFAIGSAVFWDVGGIYDAGTMAWTPEKGTVNLIRWPGDFTRGTGNFATDGTWMVWTYGEGKNPNEDIRYFQQKSIMVAPFSTDPATVAATARRLRDAPGGITLEPYAVGCGYAAHAVPIGTHDGSLLIVRITDGASWVIPGGTDLKWRFKRVLGFACGAQGQDPEVLSGCLQRTDRYNEEFELVRISISSLGIPTSQ